MNRNLAIRRLWWKELRQLWPLMALLVTCGVFFQLLYSLSPPDSNALDRQLVVLFGLPGLFAVGGGALLVGQEKERKTIEWLGSLPIAVRDIVRIKLYAGVLGLIVVWISSLLITLAAGLTLTASITDGDALIWILHSFFLLFLGYWSAWALRSSFVSLLLLLPLACMPLLAASLHAWLLGPLPWISGRFSPDSLPRALLEVYLVLFAAGCLWVGWKAGLRSMGPQAVRSSYWLGRREAATIPQAKLSPVRMGPFNALVWQFALQSRLALGGLFALFLVGCAGVYWHDFLRGAAGFLGTLAVLLSGCWMGVLVFQSDTIDRRTTFLADRGVAPWKIWCTRQLLPIAILICGTFICQVTLPSGFRDLAIVIPLGLGTFLASQWAGQIIPSPIVAAVVAPVFAASAISYSVLSVTSLATPQWLIGLTACLPLAATLVMTRRWMDGSTGVRFWLYHTAFLAVAIVLPLIPFAVFVATLPTMPPGTRQELEAVAQATNASTPSPIQLPIPKTPNAATQTSLSQIRAQHYVQLREQMMTYPAALPDQLTMRSILSDTLLIRMHLEGDADQGRLDDYRRSIGLIIEIIRRLRASPQLFDQDQADFFEIWLLEEVQLASAETWMGDENYGRAVGILADKKARDAARTRAIALSWKRRQDNDYGKSELGGVSLLSAEDQSAPLGAKQTWLMGSRADAICGLLMQLLTAPLAEQDRLREELRQLSGTVPPATNTSRIYVTDPDGERYLLYAELQRVALGSHWNGAWERTAAELSQ